VYATDPCAKIRKSFTVAGATGGGLALPSKPNGDTDNDIELFAKKKQREPDSSQ
jgi:hypothetical protein